MRTDRNSPFNPPTVPSHAIERGRLLSLVDLSVHQRVAVVVAPTGYGKTVLLSQWAAANPRRRVRWITLTPEHNDRRRFIRDLYGALASTRPPLRTTAEQGAREPAPSPSVFGSLEPLLDELQAMPAMTLIIDDLHELSNPDLVEELGCLVERSPRSLHVIVATRVDPPYRYYRSLLAGSGVELRQEDLAFRGDEAAELIEALAGERAARTEIDALLSRAEGWAVGIQLAALTLRGRTDPDGFVATVARNDRHVIEYLTEQVLRQVANDTRRFLDTSILTDLNGSLCDAVTGRSDGHLMLEALDRTSMFIANPDGRREWFRYHPLFRTMLRHHLRVEDAVLERTLLRRAAAWHMERGDVEPAVGYLVDAGAWQEVLCAADSSFRALFLEGRTPVLARWVEQVPVEVRAGRVDVMLLHAAALASGDDAREAGAVLAAIDDLSYTSAADRAVASFLRSMQMLRQGLPVYAVREADAAMRQVEAVEAEEIPALLGLTSGRADVAVGARLVRGLGRLHTGHLQAAREDLSVVIAGQHPVWQVWALGGLAVMEAWAGNLSSSEHLAARALTAGREVGLDRHWLMTDAYLAMSQVARERDELERASILLDEAATRVSAVRAPTLEAAIALERAHLALAAGRPEDGLQVLAARRFGGPPDHPPMLEAHRHALEGRLLASAGDLVGAERAFGHAPPDDSEVLAAQARVAVDAEDLDGARALLARWHHEPTPRASIERLLWLGIVEHLEGDEATASSLFADVVRYAEAERNVAVFRDAGPHALAPARSLYRSAPTPFLRAVVSPSAASSAGCGRVAGLIEQLTEREMSVLALLPTRSSNSEIAERLGVSLNTVKTHLKHIYRKLGVAGRSSAIEQAERLRIV